MNKKQGKRFLIITAIGAIILGFIGGGWKGLVAILIAVSLLTYSVYFVQAIVAILWDDGKHQ